MRTKRCDASVVVANTMMTLRGELDVGKSAKLGTSRNIDAPSKRTAGLPPTTFVM